MAARRAILSFVLAGWLLHGGPGAWAQQVLAVRYGVSDDLLTVDTHLGPAFDAGVVTRIDSGLTQRVRLVLSVHALDGEGRVVDGPVAVRVRECEVVYDLWGERFALTVIEAGTAARRVVETREQVIDTCGRFRGAGLLPVAAIDLRRRYVLQGELVLNPQAPAEDGEAGEWTGDPIGHRRGAETRGASLFGTVARLFVREPEAGDEAGRRLRSPVFDARTVRRVLAGPAGGRAPEEPTGGEEEEE